MKFQTKSTNPNTVQTDLLVVFAMASKKEGEVILTSDAAALDTSLDGLILKTIGMEMRESMLT